MSAEFSQVIGSNCTQDPVGPKRVSTLSLDFCPQHRKFRYRLFRQTPNPERPRLVKVFLVWVNDENFYRLLPEDLGGSKPGDPRIKVMGFPPLGIETLAPVLRQHGHQVRMFDTCHPEMKEPDIAQALRDDPPDVVALSFLSTTTYPGVKSMAQVVKGELPNVPVICGGVFATMNQERILKDCPHIDAVGVGEG